MVSEFCCKIIIFASDSTLFKATVFNMENLTERLKRKKINTTITLQEYINILEKKGSFIIPNYQRGYVWGQKKKDNSTDSVSYLIHTLKDAYSKEKHDVFLQGITVHEVKDSYNIVLVDGQQRTTFFYLLLKYLGNEGNLRISYDIREESNKFLKNLNASSDTSRNDNEEFQDVFFFKRTLRIFKRELEHFPKKEEFCQFILNHVKFLFVIIPEDQAQIVFTMMNGNKAIMTDEELIKAELLRCASLKHNLITEAEHSELRGRLAREWDQWLYWWNDDKVKTFFRTGDRQLGWLLPLIQKNSKVIFSEFREKLLKSPDIKHSKTVFKKMRLLQKSIEDKYNDSRSYNYLGVILYIRNSTELRYSFLRWFFTIDNEETHPKSDAELERYFNWCIIGVNHEDIVVHNYEKYREARSHFLEELQSNLLFKCHYETAYRWLIRQNIKQDNLHDGRKFNFDIERDRSLEHVYPKSKIGHTSEDGKVSLDWDDKPLDSSKKSEIKLWRKDMKWFCEEDRQEYCGSEHCIGNLVLLYKRDNSKFNDADFEKKNEYFFTDQDDDAFKSRHLIHSTMVFSDGKWTGWNPEQICRRKQKEISEFKKEYKEDPEINK